MVIMAEHGGLDYPSRAGEWPFLPSPESTAEKYVPDVSKPNPAYFDLVDWVVEEAAKLGILVALVPTWGRYSELRTRRRASQAEPSRALIDVRGRQ